MAFGPKVAPKNFTKLITVVAAHVRKQSLRLAAYLDDWLGLNATKQMLLQDRGKLINLLLDLGFIINKKKSHLEPTQKITYIGGYFNLQKGLVPTAECLQKYKKAVQIILHYLHLLGLLASCIEMIPNAGCIFFIFGDQNHTTLHSLYL